RRGGEVRTWFGRIGTRGQVKEKTFDDPDDAVADADAYVDQMIGEKEAKGYAAIGADALVRRALARPTWSPALAPGGGDADRSKFGGAPWIEDGAAWPSCGDCNRPLAFILQLRSEDAPLDLGGGLIQLFACSWCGPHAYSLVRVQPQRASTDAAERAAG